MSEARCPKCNAVLETMELPDDIRVLACPSCAGAFYDAGEIAVPLTLEGLQASTYVCPACGNRFEMGSVYDGKLPLAQCKVCKGLWFDRGEIQKLRDLSGVEGVVAHPKVPGSPLVAPAALAAIDAASAWAGGDVLDPPEGSDQQNPDASWKPRVQVDGVWYEHFQTSWPVVQNALGEFNWKVRVGDRGKARDFIAPPLIVSEDIADKDSSWSQGRYVEPEEVWRAFNLPGEPPERIGVGSNQPNPYSALLDGFRKPFLIAVTVCVCFFLLQWGTKQVVHERKYDFDNGAAEKSFVTDIFELGGHTSNLRADIWTNLDNRWADIDLALINADTDEAYDVGTEVSYYHGYEDGESWSEGSASAGLNIPAVPPGRYYMRVEPSSEGGPFSYTLRLTWGAPSLLHLLMALLALAAPFIIVWGLSNSFETRRWAESDHPRTVQTSGDDDD